MRNTLAHELATPPLITIAEEHTALPGLCAPASAGGLGFDFRQALGLPPLWARVLAPALGSDGGGPGARWPCRCRSISHSNTHSTLSLSALSSLSSLSKKKISLFFYRTVIRYF